MALVTTLHANGASVAIRSEQVRFITEAGPTDHRAQVWFGGGETTPLQLDEAYAAAVTALDV